MRNISMKYQSLILLVMLGMLVSCNDNEIFEREMYKNRIALISSGEYNLFQEIVHLNDKEVIGYIAASVGGTHAPARDMQIVLEEDPMPLAHYNYSNFDADASMYAKALSPNQYDIPDHTIRIKAGELTGRTMIKLRPEGLSPDSTYFISLKATATSGVELNPEKSTILYQVVLENDFASQVRGSSLYTMTGLVDGMVTAANKTLFPLTSNSVRMVAGTESFVSQEDAIRKTSLILTVAKDGKVTIKPYGSLEVQQIDNDPKYPNIFKVEETYGVKTNVFLLCYSYKMGKSTKVMKERVEMQVRE